MAAKRLSALDPLVQQILNETKTGEDELAQRAKRFDRSYDVYRPSETTTGSPSAARLRPKYAMQVIDTAMVNMAQGVPSCKVLPRSPDSVETARKFELAMGYFADQDHLAEKTPVTTQQTLVYGLTAGKTHWLFKEGQATKVQVDPLTQKKVGVTGKVVLRDGPSYEPWDVYDIWWEPNARNVDNAEWVALRTWASKSYLEQNRCTVTGTHDWWECDGLYHNLDDLYETGRGRKPATSAQDRLLGGDQNLKRDKFEIVEYWRDDRLTVLGNKQVLLRDMPNPHWHGKKPVVVAACRPDMFKMAGVPMTELMDDIQQALWTIENLRQDNLHMTVWKAFTYRTTSEFDPGVMEIKARALIPVTDHDDLQEIKVSPLPPEAYEEEQVLIARLQDITGITPYISGAALGTTNQNTATGVSILNSAASVLLRFMASQVQNGVWQRTFEQWGSDVQQYLEDTVYVRIVGAGGQVDFASVDPQDVVGEYDFRLEGTEESLSKAQDRQDAISLLSAFMPAIQAGLVNPKPLYEKVARAFGFENVEELLMPQPQAMPPAAPHPQNGNGAGQQLPLPPGPGQTLMHGMPLPNPAQQNVMAGQ